MLIGLVAIAALPDPILTAITNRLAAHLPVPRSWARGVIVQRAIAFEPISPNGPAQAPAPGVMTAGITFDLPPPAVVSSSTSSESADPLSQERTALPHPPDLSAPYPLDRLFVGGADSLVARAVGAAEGTRTPDGQRTQAYGGHIDPGNGVWNLGTFSYQHGAASPEEADAKQLVRLRRQAAQLRQKAAQAGILWDLTTELNGIDLANQSPLAALQQGGYIDRLAEAEKLGLVGTDAILWARTRSYLDPDTQRWNAPGLGNNLPQISRDQQRRMQAIERAIATDASAASRSKISP